MALKISKIIVLFLPVSFFLRFSGLFAQKLRIKISFFSLLLLVIIILFHQSLNIFFTQDDFHFIPPSGNFFPNFTQRYLDDEFFRPITRNVYFSLGRKLFGLNHLFYHAVNICLHFFNSALVFLILLQLTENRLYSFIVSYFYSIHESHFFSVFWISGIQELGLSFFVLTSFYFYLRYRYKDFNKFRDYLFSIFLFTIAVLSKETAMVFPVILLCYNYIYSPYSGNYKEDKNKFRIVTPYICLIFGYLALKHLVLNYSFVLKGDYYSQGFGTNIISNFLYFALRSITFLILLKIFLKGEDVDFFIFLKEISDIYLIILLILLISLIFPLVMFKFKKYGRNISFRSLDEIRVRDVKKILFFALCWFIIFLSPTLFFKKSHPSYYLSIPIIGYATIFGFIVYFIYCYILQKGFKKISYVFLVFVFILTFTMSWGIFQNKLKSKSWDTPIPNKNIFAERCITSLKRRYSNFPADSTLYFLDFTENQKWATGYGRMFKIFFSDKIKIKFIRWEASPRDLKVLHENTFFFKYDGRDLQEIR